MKFINPIKVFLTTILFNMLIIGCTVEAQLPDTFSSQLTDNIQALNDSSEQIQLLQSQIDLAEKQISVNSDLITDNSVQNQIVDLNKRLNDLETLMQAQDLIVPESNESNEIVIADNNVNQQIEEINLKIGVITQQINSLTFNINAINESLTTRIDQAQTDLLDIQSNHESLEGSLSNLQLHQHEENFAETSLINGETKFYGFNDNNVAVSKASNWYLFVGNREAPITGAGPFLNRFDEEILKNYDSGYFYSNDGYDPSVHALVPGSIVVTLQEQFGGPIQDPKIRSLDFDIDKLNITDGSFSFATDRSISTRYHYVATYQYSLK